MAVKRHDVTSRIVWTGDRGQGNADYGGYDRAWNIETPGKPAIECSNDPMLGGDPSLPNPEDLPISSLSACHMLRYLHLAGAAGIVVRKYLDDPFGVGESEPGGRGRFVKAILRPEITIAPGADMATADAIHGRVREHCFIARSVAFPVAYNARYILDE